MIESARRQAIDVLLDHWVGEWLERPSPALGGAKPADFMDTMEGQGLVTRLLLQSQVGVFA